MLPASFWDKVPPLDIKAYLEDIDEDSPVGATAVARDCEVQALCRLYFEQDFESPVDVRRRVFGEWTDNNSSLSEEEVLKLRSEVKPWTLTEEKT